MSSPKWESNSLISPLPDSRISMTWSNNMMTNSENCVSRMLRWTANLLVSSTNTSRRSRSWRRGKLFCNSRLNLSSMSWMSRVSSCKRRRRLMNRHSKLWRWTISRIQNRSKTSNISIWRRRTWNNWRHWMGNLTKTRRRFKPRLMLSRKNCRIWISSTRSLFTITRQNWTPYLNNWRMQIIRERKCSRNYRNQKRF